MISNMANVKDLNRGAELLRILLNNQGLEAALVPYLKKYEEEDGREYKFSELLDYIQTFVKSNQITPEALNKYNQIRGISASTLRNRGKEICDTLIENNFNLESLANLARKYADEDKRYEPYTMALMDRMRKFYLKDADTEYLNSYREKQEFSKRSSISDYTIEDFKTLISLSTKEDMINYIKEKNINHENFFTLRNAYFNTYPEEEETRVICDKIDDIIDELKKQEIREKNLEAHQKEIELRHKEKNDRMKEILITYLNLGRDNLDECTRVFGITTNSFLRNLKDSKEEEEDEELLDLIRQYDELVDNYEKERENLVLKIQDYYRNGVYYGYENRRFSIYEYYMLTDKGVPEVARSIRKYLPMAEAGRIINFLNNLTITRKFHDRDEFIGQLRNKYKGLERSEYEPILDYMEQMHWPYSLTLFKDIWERLSDGLITLSIPEEKSPENLNK